jgi:hypothetical protein
MTSSYLYKPKNHQYGSTIFTKARTDYQKIPYVCKQCKNGQAPINWLYIELQQKSPAILQKS